MKKRVFAALMLGSIFTVSSVNAQDPIAATVNGKEIKVSEVLAEMKGLDLGKDAPQDQVYRLILERLIELNLIKSAAEKADLKKNLDVQKALEKFEERLLVQYFVSQEMKKIVTEAAVQEAYKKLPPQKEVKLSHIMMKDEPTAKAVIKALNSGTDFATLAKSKSIDEATAKKGGDLGGALEAQLPQPFVQAIKDLKPGAYTKTPVKTPVGYHVVKLDSRTDAPFETVAPMIREGLEKEALAKLIDAEKKKAKVQMFDQEGKPMKDTPPPPALAAPAAPAVPAS